MADEVLCELPRETVAFLLQTLHLVLFVAKDDIYEVIEKNMKKCLVGGGICVILLRS